MVSDGVGVEARGIRCWVKEEEAGCLRLGDRGEVQCKQLRAVALACLGDFWLLWVKESLAEEAAGGECLLSPRILL